ncbi:MAG TPA: response regulator [Terriglobales bacterium]|nr:response regulator [Terriglobales bacterium]
MALVVDDSALICNEIGRFLRTVGYRVVTASNGLEAFVRLEEVTPSLIIAGLTMPKLNGGELIREIRHRTDDRQVTIVAIAGIHGRSVPSPKAGADHVIFKGVDLVEQLQLALGTSISAFGKRPPRPEIIPNS